MKIKSIKQVGKKPVFDITVKDAEHYILENGVVTHNTGIYYSADTIIIFGRQQEKDGTELQGFNFILNVDKSRFVKEKSKIPLTVLYSTGISKYSGILELAVESGIVAKGKYSRSTGYALVDQDTGEVGEMVPEKKTATDEFLGVVLQNPRFKEWVKNKYKLSSVKTEVSEEEIDADLEDFQED